MPHNTTPTLQSKLTTALCQDPKKAGVLGFLVLILLIAWARLMIGGGHPAPAAGSLVMPAAGASPILIPSPVFKPGGAAASLRGWLSTPIPQINRNDFVVKSEYFPQDATKTNPTPADSGFWSALAKSLSLQADQKEKRDAVIANLKVQAAALRPTSTVMGASPRAMINGALVREGDWVGAFRVLKIEPHGIVVEHEGIRLAVPMN